MMVSGGQADTRFASVYRSFEDIRPLYDKQRRKDRQIGKMMVSGGQANIRFASVYRSFEDIRTLYDKQRRRDRQAGEVSLRQAMCE